MLNKGYFAGATRSWGVVGGRGRAAEGRRRRRCTPEEALYAVTTAWVTSVLGTAHDDIVLLVADVEKA